MPGNLTVRKLQSTIYFTLVALSVFGLDQFTKQAVTEHLHLHQSIDVIPGFFSLTYVRNTGAAFGILSGSEKWRIYFFLTVGLLALILIFRFFYSNHDKPLVVIGTGLICGGAAGNLADRIRLGYVVDFFDFFIKGLHWPAFNVADSAITVGVFLTILNFLLDRTD